MEQLLGGAVSEHIDMANTVVHGVWMERKEYERLLADRDAAIQRADAAEATADKAIGSLKDDCDVILRERARAEMAERERDAYEQKWRDVLDAEHAVSNAYVRLRAKLDAFKTPYAATLEQIAAHTEPKLDTLIAERDDLRALAGQLRIGLEQLHASIEAWRALGGDEHLSIAIERAAESLAATPEWAGAEWRGIPSWIAGHGHGR